MNRPSLIGAVVGLGLVAVIGAAWVGQPTGVKPEFVGDGTTDNTDALQKAIDAGRGSVHLTKGVYRITFDVQAYFSALGTASFYPAVAVLFEISDPGQHYHVPLLISPFGYSTYRGS